MTDSKPQNPTDRLCSKHEDAWRDPLEIPSQIPNIASMDSKLFECRIHGQWWQVIAELGITLFVTREYEHLILAFGVVGSTPRVSFYPLPHPSGMVFHPEKNTLFIAGSRNPKSGLFFSTGSRISGPLGCQTRCVGFLYFVESTCSGSVSILPRLYLSARFGDYRPGVACKCRGPQCGDSNIR